MKKEKFTPGPWVQLKNSDATDILIGGEKEYVCRVNSHISKNNANAALIAAAPELYEALKEADLHIRGLLEIFNEAKEVLPSDIWGDFDSVLYLAGEANFALPGILNLLAKARGENVE